jgi:GT2 family glycosyltransferase
VTARIAPMTPPVPAGPPTLPSVGAVVLTQGKRTKALRRAVESLLAQSGVDLDIVVIGNGADPGPLPDGVHVVVLPANEGTPAGRNAGVPYVRGELLFFLDDDARLDGDRTLAKIAERFAADPELGILQPRVADPTGLAPPRRWTPRLRVGDPTHSSDVAALWEGAVAVPRSVFERVGGWPAEFFFMHEGIDLAWAVWGAGWRVHYAGDLVAFHPAVSDGNNPGGTRLAMRNRVFLARRRLPLPLGVCYVLTWLAITIVRGRRPAVARAAFRGVLAGLRENPGRRRPISWRAVWRMTRAGRPPVI